MYLNTEQSKPNALTFTISQCGVQDRSEPLGRGSRLSPWVPAKQGIKEGAS